MTTLSEYQEVTNAAVLLELAAIEGRLAYLRGERGAASQLAAVTVAADKTVPVSVKSKAKRGKRAQTPEQLASRQLQGKFLSLIRRVPKTKRAFYSAMAKESGREAAVEAMRAR